jgi:hypothetical protein
VGEVRFEGVALLQPLPTQEPPTNVSKSSHDAKLDATRATCEEREQHRPTFFDLRPQSRSSVIRRLRPGINV